MEQSTESQVRAMRQMLWGDVDAGRSTAASGGDMDKTTTRNDYGEAVEVWASTETVWGVDAADDGAQ